MPLPAALPIPQIKHIEVRRPNRKKFQDMSIFELCEWTKARKEGTDQPVIRGEYIPPPPMTQAQMEAQIYGYVNAGQMRLEGAEHLLAALARETAKNEGRVLPGSPPAPPSAEALAAAKRLSLNRRLLDADLPSRYWGLRLDLNPFLTERSEDGQPVPYDLQDYNALAFRACRRLAARWKPGTTGLTLQSLERGVSKTLLAAAVGVYVAATGTGRQEGQRARVRFVKAGDLFTLFSRSYGATWEKNPGTLSTEQVWQTYAVRPDLLIIDDLGTEEGYRSDAGAFGRERFYQLLDHRYGEKKTVMVTTQLDETSLSARYGGHVASRLLGIAPLLPITGSPDYRPAEMTEEDDDPFAD